MTIVFIVLFGLMLLGVPVAFAHSLLPAWRIWR